MHDPNQREPYRTRVADVQAKLGALAADTYIRSALTEERLREIGERVESDTVENLSLGYWRPVFCYVSRHSLSDLQGLEGDIGLVVAHSIRRLASDVTRFLGAEPEQDREWRAGLFETFVKSRLLRTKALAVELDWALPNGKKTDLRLAMDGKAFHVECTVMTESDEDRQAYDRYMEALKSDSNLTLIRPGTFDEPDFKGPSPYYDCLRVYLKVYDKIAPKLNPANSQLPEEGANILALSLDSSFTTLSATEPGVAWALDDLFANQPRAQPRLENAPTGRADVSLLTWLDFYAKELSGKSELDLDWYCEHFHEILAAPKRIGGVLLFDSCALKGARLNYNALPSCAFTHRQMAMFEGLLGAPPSWFSP